MALSSCLAGYVVKLLKTQIYYGTRGQTEIFTEFKKGMEIFVDYFLKC